MVKSCIFKYVQQNIKYVTIYIYIYIYIYVYIRNLGYVKVLSEHAINKVNIIVCIRDLVIIKYFGKNTIEIKRLVFTYMVVDTDM
jgi:hypothetical protein